jgi:hypothetical protein
MHVARVFRAPREAPAERGDHVHVTSPAIFLYIFYESRRGLRFRAVVFCALRGAELHVA